MRLALVPGVLALLPAYAGSTDPVAELRAACLAAVAWLGDDVTVLGDPQGRRVGESLLAAAGPVEPGPAPERAPTPTPAPAAGGAAYLLVGNGSACRSEQAPGHLDDRARAFDDALAAYLHGHGPLPDADLARQLLAATAAFDQLPPGLVLDRPTTDYAGDPFGVQYWVMRWER